MLEEGISEDDPYRIERCTRSALLQGARRLKLPHRSFAQMPRACFLECSCSVFALSACSNSLPDKH
eukprot:9205184-Alexandrium_andersonii.AAC.1